jgi:hypothetical protein
VGKKMSPQPKSSFAPFAVEKHSVIIRHMKNSTIQAVCLTILFSCLHIGHSQAQASNIPEAVITSLQAAHFLAGPFPKKKDERFAWTSPRFHGRALANMKLELWDTALEDIDKALANHDPKSFRHDVDHPCASMVEMRTPRAIIPGKLGRIEEAQAAHKLATSEPTPYRTSIYGEFHDKLKELRRK